MIAALGLLTLMLAAPAEATTCVGASEALYEQGDALAAARRAEQCWREERDPRALLVASQASLSARRFAEAWLFARRFLGVDRSKGRSAQRTMAELIVTETASATGQVQVRLEPPPTANETITLTIRRDGEPDEAAIAVERGDVDRDAAGFKIRLDPGSWQLTLERPGFVRRRAAVDSSVQQASALTIEMRRRGSAATATTLTREALSLSFTPASAVRRGIAVELRPAGTTSAPALTFEVRSAQLGLWLAPGRWQVRATAGKRSAEQLVETGGAAALKVRLR